MPKKILVIEDSLTQAYFMKMQLEKIGFEVILASNGIDGINKAKEKLPNLIILDVMMPQVSGYEVCETLKKSFETKIIPIIIYTERSRKLSEHSAKHYGADMFVAKENFITPEGFTPDMVCKINKLINGEKIEG